MREEGQVCMCNLFITLEDRKLVQNGQWLPPYKLLYTLISFQPPS